MLENVTVSVWGRPSRQCVLCFNHSTYSDKICCIVSWTNLPQNNANVFHLSWIMSPHYLVKHKTGFKSGLLEPKVWRNERRSLSFQKVDCLARSASANLACWKIKNLPPTSAWQTVASKSEASHSSMRIDLYVRSRNIGSVRPNNDFR